MEKHQSHYCISHLSTSCSTQNGNAFSILVFNAEQVHEAQLGAREPRGRNHPAALAHLSRLESSLQNHSLKADAVQR